jgi:hypothetical protein
MAILFEILAGGDRPRGQGRLEEVPPEPSPIGEPA